MSVLRRLLDKTPIGYVPFILFLVIVGIGVARFVPQLYLPEPPALLTPAEGLQTMDDLDDARTIAGQIARSSVFPTGVTVAAFGIYTQPTERFPAQTTAIVTEKNGWRFAEILMRPNMDLQAVISGYAATSTTSVTLAPGLEATMLSIDTAVPICLDGRNGHPGTCVIHRVLVIPLPDLTISLASDPRGATEGELVDIGQKIARAFLAQHTEPSL